MISARKKQRRCVLVFARAPVPGQCKTRLIPYLGNRGAAHLHQYLIRDTLRRVLCWGKAHVELWCAPHCHHPAFIAMRRDLGIALHRQVGRDLGERMAYATNMALKKSEQVFVIGTDCPGLNQMHLNAASAALDHGADVVLVPALDGGYVLIGVQRYLPGVFRGIRWGTQRVLKQTLANIRSLSLNAVELTALPDLDSPNDVRCAKYGRFAWRRTVFSVG